MPSSLASGIPETKDSGPGDVSSTSHKVIEEGEIRGESLFDGFVSVLPVMPAQKLQNLFAFCSGASASRISDWEHKAVLVLHHLQKVTVDCPILGAIHKCLRLLDA